MLALKASILFSVVIQNSIMLQAKSLFPPVGNLRQLKD